MVEHKDVVLAIVGASAALSGLVLVFLGLVVGAYGGLAGDTPKAVKKPLRTTGWVVLVAFIVGIACAGAGTAWLIMLDAGEPLYALTVILFLAQLVSLIVASVWTLKELLWD